MTTAITTPSSQMTALTNLIRGAKNRLAATLAGAIDPKQFATAALQCVRRNPRLLECNPASFMTALLEGAQLGLHIGDGAAAEAHLVHYNGECKLIPGYRGLLRLLYQHPRVATPNFGVVYANDVYKYTAAPPRVEHTPSSRPDRGKMVAAYFECYLTNASLPVVFWMWGYQIEAVRDGAPGSKRRDSPWHTHPEAMWIKTVIRHGVKYLPRSQKLIMATNHPDPDLDSQDAAVGAGNDAVEFDWSTEEEEAAPPAKPVHSQTAQRPSTDKHADLRAKVRDLANEIGEDKAERLLGGVGIDGLREVGMCSADMLESAVRTLNEEKMRQINEHANKVRTPSRGGKDTQPDLIPGSKEVMP